MRPRRGVVALLGVATALTGPSVAAATDGNLYAYGSSIWATSPQFQASVLAGPVWQLQAPALSPAALGNHWEMNWGCPVAGSEIAAVRFGALRTQAPSSLAVRVTGDRRVLWEEGDVAIPQSPAGGRAYDVALPPGHCNVHLALSQVEARNQHARGYFIDNPGVLVRDVAPPSVLMRSLPGGWLGPGSGLPVEWAVTDNFGDDGVAVQRVIVAGQERWAGTPGVGDHRADVGLDGVPDGVHVVTVRAEGDGTAHGEASGTVRVDRTAPAAADLSAVATGQPGVVAAGWTASDNLSGVASSTLELNAAPDGRTGGAWIPLAATDGAGRREVATVARVPDGVHAWRVRSTDVAGNTSHADGIGPVVVDTTPPSLDLHDVPGGWVGRLDLDLTASDNLEGNLGPVAVEIDVNAAPDGSDGGEWLRRARSPGPAGRRIVPLGLGGLSSGRHVLRVVARNGGPLAETLATERRVVLRADLDRPVVSRTAFTGGRGRPLTVAWTAEDAHSGVTSATVQWRDGAAWRTLAAQRTGDGTGSVTLDVAALPAGRREMRVLIADGAGNTAARTGTVLVAHAGGGGTTTDPVARLRTARLALAVRGARVEFRRGRRTLIRRIRAGGTIVVRGRLTDRSGRGMAGSDVQAHGFRGRVVGRALTRRNGSFVLVARPRAGGRLRIGVPVAATLLPARPTADVRAEVRPRLAFAVSDTAVPAGRRVLFTGRLRPAPSDLGLGPRKGIVLEWRDPVRRSWRPVVNARIRRDGTFAIPWTYGLRGLTIPMRATVPAEVGWPLLPARSGVIRVQVR